MQAFTLVKNPVLQLGSQGNLVKELQQLLNLFDAKLATDGNFGAATKKAVINFQVSSSAYQLLADGIVGHLTWSALYDRVFLAAPSAMPILQRGSRGEAVQRLQLAFGFKLADGDFGAVTEAVVQEVQTAAQLSVTGIVDSKTWVAVYQRNSR